ncbi:MAG: ribosome maturation factor RimM, partial [Burkholderiales bacterium]
MSRKLPERLVIMGRIAAPFGVKGWVKVQPLTARARSLLDYPAWWVERNGEWHRHEVAAAKVQT